MPLYQNPARDGGKLGWLNCNTTVTAMQIAFETMGIKHPDGGEVRDCCINADGSKDIAGGTKPSQVIDAAQRCFGVVLDGRVLDFEEAWRLGQRVDYAISFSISYAVISGTVYDGSPGFRGFHQVLLSGGRIYDPLADGRRAGIPKGPQRWPKALLRRAAGKYASTGEGRATVVVAREPDVKPKRYSVLFEPGAIFLYQPGNGAPVGPTGTGTGVKWTRDDDAGVSRKSSAPSTAPFNVAWGNGRKRLVTLTAGKYAGKSVEPSSTHLHLKEFAA